MSSTESESKKLAVVIASPSSDDQSDHIGADLRNLALVERSATTEAGRMKFSGLNIDCRREICNCYDMISRSRAAEASHTKFMELGVDCLRCFCDRLDIKTLLALAATCQQMQAIARASFAARKLTTVAYDPQMFFIGKRMPAFAVSNAEKECWADTEEFFANQLEHFGEHFTSAYVNCYRLKLTNVLVMFERLSQHCGGTLQKLYLGGLTLQPSLLTAVAPLMAKLTELSLFDCSSYHLPFDMCQQLQTLELESTPQFNANQLVRRCLNTKFPRLTCIKVKFCGLLQSDFNRFIRTHPQLTHVAVPVYHTLDYSVLAQLEHLETLYIHDINESLLALVGLKRLKSLTINQLPGDVLQLWTRFLQQATVLRNNLEELRVLRVVSLNARDLRLYFGQLKGLRVVRMNVHEEIKQFEFGKIVEKLINELPLVNKIDMQIIIMPSLRKSDFNRLDRICTKRGIALDMYCAYPLPSLANGDVILRNFDRRRRMVYRDSYFVYWQVHNYFGRREPESN